MISRAVNDGKYVDQNVGRGEVSSRREDARHLPPLQAAITLHFMLFTLSRNGTGSRSAASFYARTAIHTVFIFAIRLTAALMSMNLSTVLHAP